MHVFALKQTELISEILTQFCFINKLKRVVLKELIYISMVIQLRDT